MDCKNGKLYFKAATPIDDTYPYKIGDRWHALLSHLVEEKNQNLPDNLKEINL